MSDRPEWPDDDADDLPDIELPDGGDRDARSRSGEPAAERPRTPVTQQIGRIVVVVLLAVFVVFAVSNSQRVDFSWVVGATEVTTEPATGETTGGVPLIVLLLAAFAVGAVVGAALVRAIKRRRARAAAEREGR